MSGSGKPVGASLLRLFGPWLDGVRLAAGQCLLSYVRPATRLVGQPCPDGCPSLICGPTPEQLAERLADHRQRCPALGVTVRCATCAPGAGGSTTDRRPEQGDLPMLRRDREAMTDPQWQVIGRWHTQLTEMLAALALPLAESNPRQPLEAATPEQVDLVGALKVLGEVTQNFAADAIAAPPHATQWTDLGDALIRAGKLCQEQGRRRVVVDGDRPIVEPPRPFSASGP